MNPAALALIPTLLFGIIAVYFSIKEEKIKKELAEREQKQKQRIYEISILREIQERIGYELDMEKVADVITGSLKNLFIYSTVSSLLIKDQKLLFKVNAEEHVSRVFLDQVKNSMTASLSALTNGQLPQVSDEVVTGVLLDNDSAGTLASFFHIPLAIGSDAVGVITLASTKPALYKQEEITVLYQIANLATSTITKLRTVLTTEKGKLLATIASLSDGIFMINEKKELLVINNAAKTFLGLTKENPDTIDVLSSMQKTYDIKAAIEAVSQTKQPAGVKEIVLTDKILQVFVHPVLDSETNTIGVSVLLHNVTLEKNLEEMKDEFTNMIIHELRAPLVAIRGAAQLLRTNVESQTLSAEERRKLLSVTADQSTKLLDLVGSLLDAAKLEAGKFSIQKAPNDLLKVLEQSVFIFQAQAMQKHITLTLQKPESMPEFPFDPFRISQVMNNLLSNALKFTPANGQITVTVQKKSEARNTKLETNTNDQNLNNKSNLVAASDFDIRNSNFDFVEISVSDTGIGIPKERQANLFSKFYQVQHDAKDIRYVTAGTGLGLYIVKGIVEMHGGKINVNSPASPSLGGEPGKGTTFTISLPTTPTQEQTHQPEAESAQIQTTQALPPPPPSQFFHTTVN